MTANGLKQYCYTVSACSDPITCTHRCLPFAFHFQMKSLRNQNRWGRNIFLLSQASQQGHDNWRFETTMHGICVNSDIEDTCNAMKNAGSIFAAFILVGMVRKNHCSLSRFKWQFRHHYNTCMTSHRQPQSQQHEYISPISLAHLQRFHNSCKRERERERER